LFSDTVYMLAEVIKNFLAIFSRIMENGFAVKRAKFYQILYSTWWLLRLRHPTCRRKHYVFGLSSAAFVRSSGQILLVYHDFIKELSNLDKTITEYLLASIADLIIFWTLEVKGQGHSRPSRWRRTIHGNAGSSKSTCSCSMWDVCLRCEQGWNYWKYSGYCQHFVSLIEIC